VPTSYVGLNTKLSSCPVLIENSLELINHCRYISENIIEYLLTA